MKIVLLPMAFSVCQVEAFSIPRTPYTFTGCTEEENSLVCPTAQAPDHCLNREDGWRCFRVAGQLDFSLIGVLAGIAGCLAAREIPIFVLSTYNTDYILVKEERLTESISALKAAGYEITA